MLQMSAAAVAGSGDVTSGLVLDLEADFGVYSDAGSTPAVNNDLVQQHNSRVGGHIASQATSGLRPVFKTNQLNGYPAIEYNADELAIADHADLSLEGNSTLVWLAKWVSISGSDFNGFLSKDNGGSAGEYFYGMNVTSGKPLLDRPFIEGGVEATNAPGTAAFRIGVCIVSGTTVSHYLDDVANGTDTLAGGTAVAVPLRFGRYSTGVAPGNFLFVRSRLYNRALSVAEKTAVYNLYRTKYGL